MDPFPPTHHEDLSPDDHKAILGKGLGANNLY